MKAFTTSRLVKSEDLNHHGTLFAGRMSEWFVEGCFIAAATTHGKPEEIVCIKLHGLKFGKPAKKGEMIKLSTYVVLTGRSSITVYGKVTGVEDENISVEGYITFVCVDENGRTQTHNLNCPIPENSYEQALQDFAKTLR